jgi:PHB/PHA accumulation regulator DNA-binding domain
MARRIERLMEGAVWRAYMMGRASAFRDDAVMRAGKLTDPASRAIWLKVARDYHHDYLRGARRLAGAAHLIEQGRQHHMPIVKYSNRRLYSTEKRRYVGVREIQDELLKGQRVTLKGPKYNGDKPQDVTREVILQLLTTQVQEGASVPTREQLLALVRAAAT